MNCTDRHHYFPEAEMGTPCFCGTTVKTPSSRRPGICDRCRLPFDDHAFNLQTKSNERACPQKVWK